MLSKHQILEPRCSANIGRQHCAHVDRASELPAYPDVASLLPEQEVPPREGHPRCLEGTREGPRHFSGPHG